MSHYINLYRDVAAVRSGLRHSSLLLAALLILFLVEVGIGLFVRFQARALEAKLADQAVVQKVLDERLVALGRRSGGNEGFQIGDLERRLKVRAEILAALDAGALGSLDGYVEHLSALARNAGKGIWITGLEIGKNGSVELSGRTMQAERVPEYLAALNGEGVFRGRKMASLSMERVQASGSSAAEGGGTVARAPAAIAFRLGTELPNDSGAQREHGAHADRSESEALAVLRTGGAR